MTFELRVATEADNAFLDLLYVDVHRAEFAPLNLPVAALAQLLQMQALAQRTGYAAQFPGAESLIVCVGPYPVGRLMVWQSEAELRLVDIALLHSFCRSGIGTAVMKTLCDRAVLSGLPLRLSVRPSNPAAALYRRLGFVTISTDDIQMEMEFQSSKAVRPTPTTDDRLPDSAEGIPLAPEATYAYFRSMVGGQLSARSAARSSSLTLVDVVRISGPSSRSARTGDSFVIGLEGPRATALTQAIYAVDFAGGVVFDIFLGPVSQTSESFRYEAVFNREGPPAATA
jgi:ribosomal protein S18 acetylase RimI-like enzyme